MGRLRRVVLGAGATAAFVLLATGNSGAYRYGVGDQAFYIPAILNDIQPELFPRDDVVFAAQERWLAFDELSAGVVAATGLSLPSLFVAFYVLTLVLVLSGAVGISRAFYQHPWSAVAFGAALTLRHSIARGAVNTLEGYMHPRMLVFGLGLVALGAWMRGRVHLALGLAIASMALHPTTGIFFVIWIGAAAMVDEPRMRRWLLPVAVVGATMGVVLLFHPAGGSPRVMDEAWIAVFAGKSYIFPTDWRLDTWLLHLAYPAVIAGLYRWRVHLGLTVPRERGLVAGSLVLVALFLLSLPLVAARLSLAVQLQLPRVFWMADLTAILYLVWLFAESPIRERFPARRVAPIAVAALLLAGSAARGTYLMLVRYPDRPLFRVDLPWTPWTDALGWVREHTAADAHLLLDPQHVWTVGSSGRVVAARDVLLEDDKDTSMSFYSRDLAMRIAERREAVGHFDAMDEQRALALALRYDLRYVVSSATLALPVAYERGGVRVYSLSPVDPPGSPPAP